MGGLALSKVGYDRYLKFRFGRSYSPSSFVPCCAFHRDRSGGQT